MNFLWIRLVTIAIILTPFATYAKDRIFVTNEKSNTMSVIDAETLKVEHTIDVGDRPRGIGLSPDSSELYVAISEENKIVVLDPNSLKILRDFEAGSDPETFGVHPNGNIYISNEDDAKASVFNPKTGKQLAEIKVGLEPEGVAISPDGKRVIVTSESTNMLHVIKAPENVIESNILIGSRPRAAVFTKSGDIAYATAEISGEVVKVDMNKAKILKTASLGDAKAKPKDVILAKDEKTIYVEEALHRLVELHFKIGLIEESKKYAVLLGYNYQSSKWYEETYKVLNKDYVKISKNKNKAKEDSIIKKFKDLLK